MRVLSLTALFVATFITCVSSHPLFFQQKELAPKNVVCPDKDSECPDGTTCCQELSGAWACCPETNGVCCPDHVHCCPNKYKCNDKAGKCLKGDTAIDFLTKLPALKTPQNVICPDKKSECASGNTCCIIKSGNYGCCPKPNATCCPDKVHCCPEGFKCGSSDCVGGDLTVPFLEKVPTVSSSPQRIECPDKQSSCSDDNTCCLTTTGVYGCCPKKNAVCCSDKVHCCPSGYTCEKNSGICKKGDETIPSFVKQPALYYAPQDTICPGGKFKCPTNQTCCNQTGGAVGCCPMHKAVCCPDKIHCCPEGFTCGNKSGTCLKADITVPFLIQEQALNAPENVVCPDESECEDGQTCCKEKSGNYGCCPEVDGVCCSDEVHCCPKGFKCNVKGGTCIKEDETIPFLSHQLPVNAPENVICPDSESECADGQTCCKEKSGNYGCCPEVDGVCCTDEVHCCPKGFSCNVKGGTCVKEDETVPFLSHQPLVNAPMTETAAENVVCPDKLNCPGEKDTCCETSTNVYGCCPHLKAVCCPDKIHCCPEGYTCHDEKCLRHSASVPFLDEKTGGGLITLFKNEDPTLVTCPDRQSVCPDGDTCCKDNTGGYVCCPVKNAVCCKDNVHCCPGEYTCDDKNQRCVKKGLESIPFIERLPSNPIELQAIKLKTRKTSETCPDSHTCSSGETCCAVRNGGYGCCHFSNAVCCSDEEHCCPENYDCDVAGGVCTRRGRKSLFLQKLKFVSSSPSVSDIVKDNKCSGRNNITCTNEQTCCPLPEMESGCCPMVNAVCCGDRMHCCPAGFSCDITKQQCNKADEMQPITQLFRVGESSPNEPQSITCPDKSKCPDSTTCCETTDSTYGCCNHPDAKCCVDKVHCCPRGYICDDDNKNCKANGSSIPFLTVQSNRVDMIPLTFTKTAKNVVCPDNSLCEVSQTCCQSASGGYACCPVQSAVCCNDKKHCCPKGFTCKTEIGKCQKGDLETELLVKLPSLKSESKDVPCPGGGSCPSGNTCCENGCCPAANAVCCSDRETCCPEGYSCDDSTGMCRKSDLETELLAKLLILKSKIVPSPDSCSCPYGDTCCLDFVDQYLCCPALNAVCCSDRKHCCPNGYICDVKDGTCLPFLEKLPMLKSPQNVVCPDQKSECEDKQTCCKDFRGEMSCCTIENAVCCSDGKHCCPEGFKCDPDQGICTKSVENLFTLVQKQQPPYTAKHVTCPDSQSQCPDGNTCCKLPNGEYGCCPRLNAVCCSDSKYCCPYGTTCDLKNLKCIATGSSGDDDVKAVPILTKTLARIMNPEVVVCPDGKTTCPNQNTCCELEGGYACCDAAQATCCNDKIHCCPHNYQCQPGSNKCTKNLDTILAMFLTPPPSTDKPQTKLKTKDSICSDQEHWCPDNTTCCAWGCCPSVNAVCCGEMEHCCAAGFTCGSDKTCILEAPLINHASATKKTVPKNPSEKCPDDQNNCSEDTTCCPSKEDTYACCPTKNAVCCPDRVHCCPEKTVCDTHGRGKCRPSDEVGELLEMLSLKKIDEDLKSPDIVCPDDQNKCSEDTTCCPSKEDIYACCPTKNAVCCPDRVHCCPEKTVCDTHGRGKCRPSNEVGELLEMLSLKKIDKDLESPNIVCPDDQNKCSEDTTCCPSKEDTYACCPTKNAVCCPDRVHCCPEKTVCDTHGRGKCRPSNEVGDLLEMLSLKKIDEDPQSPSEICPDNQSQCNKDNTCCLSKGNSYGCCPTKNAVCCADHVHCCPEDTTCDLKAGKCRENEKLLELLNLKFDEGFKDEQFL